MLKPDITFLDIIKLNGNTIALIVISPMEIIIKKLSMTKRKYWRRRFHSNFPSSPYIIKLNSKSLGFIIFTYAKVHIIRKYRI